MTPLRGPSLLHTAGFQTEGLVVIFHGYGANGDNFIAIGNEWQRTLPTLDFIAPHGAFPWEGGMTGGYQWFSLADWDVNRIEKDMDALRPILEDFIAVELQKRNLGYENLVIAGFSQGAMLALDLGLHGKNAPAGIIAYSGAYISTKPLSSKTIPVLLIHGAEDEILTSEGSVAAHLSFQRHGVASQLHILEDLEHSIDRRGILLGEEFIGKSLAVSRETASLS